MELKRVYGIERTAGSKTVNQVWAAGTAGGEKAQGLHAGDASREQKEAPVPPRPAPLAEENVFSDTHFSLKKALGNDPSADRLDVLIRANFVCAQHRVFVALEGQK